MRQIIANPITLRSPFSKTGRNDTDPQDLKRRFAQKLLDMLAAEEHFEVVMLRVPCREPFRKAYAKGWPRALVARFAELEIEYEAGQVYVARRFWNDVTVTYS